MRLYFFLASIIGLFFVVACDQDTRSLATIEDYGYDYFPLEIGKEIIYKVDSTVFDTLSTGPFSYQNTVLVKEVIVDSYPDNAGNTVYSIDRYERPDSTTSWMLTNVWSAYQNEEIAVWQEDNVPLIKLVFPLTRRRDWDPTRFFPNDRDFIIAGENVQVFKEWDAEVDVVGEPDEINGLTFDEVTTITVANSETVIELRYGIEKYAKNVGLIYRELHILDSQNAAQDSLAWEDRAQKGFILRQEILSYN